jgi:hypothetical protein
MCNLALCSGKTAKIAHFPDKKVAPGLAANTTGHEQDDPALSLITYVLSGATT